MQRLKKKNFFWILFLISLILFQSCARVSVKKVKKVKREDIYTGKMWWKLVIKTKKGIKKYGGKANFQVSDNYLSIKIKTFFGTTAGLLLWEKNNSAQLRLYDFLHKKLYILNTTNSQLKEIPALFLGKKYKKFLIQFKCFSVSYYFNSTEKKGKIKNQIITFLWKIKTLKREKKLATQNLKKFYEKDEKFKKVVINL